MIQKGIFEVTKRTVSRALQALFRVRTHLLFALDCTEAQMPKPTEGESFQVITQGNLSEMTPIVEALLSMSQSPAEYIRDVRRGRIEGFVILSYGKVVHYGFLFLRNKSACILGLDEQTALIGNAFTTPEYRGKGAQSRSVLARSFLAREAGYGRVIAETSPNNHASQKGMQRGGMRLLGRMDLAVVFSLLVIRWRRPRKFRLLGICMKFG